MPFESALPGQVKTIVQIFVPLLPGQRALRRAVPSAYRVERDDFPTVCRRQMLRQFVALVEPALPTPLAAQRHGHHGIYRHLVQPGGLQTAHQGRQCRRKMAAAPMLECVQHAADGRFVMHRRPQLFKRRRIFLTSTAHRHTVAFAAAARTNRSRIDRRGGQVVQTGRTDCRRA